MGERDKHHTWGSGKLLVTLGTEFPDIEWPAPSTVHEILKRNGRIQSKRPRRKHEHPGKPFVARASSGSAMAASAIP